MLRRAPSPALGLSAYFATLLALAPHWGCIPDSTSASPAESAVGAASEATRAAGAPVTVAFQSWPTIIRVHGSFIPEEAAVLGAKVPGRVAAVLVDVGDVVEQGATLARLDPVQLELEVKRAEAQLAQACAAIGLEPHESTSDIVPENSPVVRQEKALLDQAEIAFQRAKRLRASGAATEEELTDREAAFKVAAARHAASLNALAEKIALIGVRRSEVEVAQNALKESSIVAPFDGIIQERSTAAGAYLREGDPVVSIVRCDQVRFLGAVPEKQAAALRVGQKVTVLLAGETEPRHAQVDRLRPVLDPMSRALMFEADVADANCQIQPGRFAEAEVIVDPSAQALVVPRSAIEEFAGVEKAWRLIDGKAEQTVVRTGPRSDTHVVILSGLAGGDVVLVKE